MSETDLVLLYTRRLEGAGFTYMITGSVAGVFYGEPRVTHDVDLVLALAPSDTARMAALFPLEEFYCPPEEIIVREVLRAQRGHFNLIHHESGFKADVYLANRDPFHRWALSERRLVEVDGEPASMSSSENWSSIAKAARKNTSATSRRCFGSLESSFARTCSDVG